MGNNNSTDVTDGLTKRQRKFVEELLNPLNRTYVEAYRKAYNPAPESLPKTVRDNASRLRAHSGVVAALEAARVRMERERARDALATRRAVTTALWNEVDTDDSNSSSRVAALRLLGLDAGMFAERQRIEVSEPLPESEADILAAIEETLRGAIADREA